MTTYMSLVIAATWYAPFPNLSVANILAFSYSLSHISLYLWYLNTLVVSFFLRAFRDNSNSLSTLNRSSTTYGLSTKSYLIMNLRNSFFLHTIAQRKKLYSKSVNLKSNICLSLSIFLKSSSLLAHYIRRCTSNRWRSCDVSFL